MKIGQPNPGAVTSTSSPATGASKPGTGVAEAGSSHDIKKPGVAVSLSAQTKNLTQLGHADAEVDMDKVKAVAAAIENGTFKVNPEAIADKLLANAQEMLQGRIH